MATMTTHQDYSPTREVRLSPMFIVCISRSHGKLTWSNRLCHRSMFDSTFCPFANNTVLTSLVLTMNILSSQCAFTMTFPSSSMKQPRCVNRTKCIPCSTICLSNTRFFMIVGTCSTFMSFPFCPMWLRGTSLPCLMVCGVSSPVLTTPGFSGFSKVREPLLVTRHMI